MNEENPILILVLMGIVGYIAFTWWSDFGKSGSSSEQALLPGASKASRKAVAVAIVGTVALLLGEVFGEISLGIADAQSQMTILFACYTLFAAFGEEFVFRGFLYYDKGGSGLLVTSCVAVSVLFALLHGYVVKWEEGAILFDFGTKALFSTSAIFVGSLWFYWLRFNILNPTCSLIPCIVAHLTKNLGVILVKAAQGHLVGLY
ncbi:CPBP family intramembrane metalloprotease [Puniceicoccaceae bacterium K14]|nr:CPBP family intramembrane metalloprotease [Puniceicoccaceae bacterium K14]